MTVVLLLVLSAFFNIVIPFCSKSSFLKNPGFLPKTSSCVYSKSSVKELFTYKVNLSELRLNEIILPTANLNDEIVVTLLDPTTFSQESNPEAYPENVREHLENEGSVLLLHYLKP